MKLLTKIILLLFVFLLFMSIVTYNSYAAFLTNPTYYYYDSKLNMYLTDNLALNESTLNKTIPSHKLTVGSTQGWNISGGTGNYTNLLSYVGSYSINVSSGSIGIDFKANNTFDGMIIVQYYLNDDTSADYHNFQMWDTSGNLTQVGLVYTQPNLWHYDTVNACSAGITKTVGWHQFIFSYNNATKQMNASIDGKTCHIFTSSVDGIKKFQVNKAGGNNVFIDQFFITNAKTIPNIFVDNCTNYTLPFLNISYYDQKENNLITVNGGYNLYFKQDELITTFNSTFNNKNNNIFCSQFELSNIETYGSLTLTKPDYASQFYEITSSSPIISSTYQLNQNKIYMIRLNESSTIVFTWKTSSYEPIGGTMLIYKCNGDGSKDLISSLPITNGQSDANLELLNVPYSYEVVYDGVTYVDDEDYSKCHIETQTTRDFIVYTGEYKSPVIGLYSVSCNVTKTSNTSVKVAWGSNPENTATITGCIYAQRISATGSTLIYTNCTSTSNSIERTIPVSGYEYNVYGKIFQSGYSMQCEDSVEFGVDQNVADTFKLSGIFAIILLIVGLILVFSNEEPEYYPIIGILALIGAFILGWTAFGWITISALLSFVIIIIYIGRYGRKE